MLEAVHRSDQTKITTFVDRPLGDVVCINCGSASTAASPAALDAKDETDAVWAAIDDP